MSFAQRGPVLDERPAALEHDVGGVERLVKECRDGALETRRRAEVL